MTLNFMFHLGLPGKCIYKSIENPPNAGALRAPTLGGLKNQLGATMQAAT